MKKIICLAFLCYGFVFSAFADEKKQVSELAQTKITTVMSLLRDSSLSPQKRNDQIVDALTPVIDFDRMGKISIGKKAWKQMTKAQRKEYLELFVSQVQNSILEKLELYTDEKLELKDVSEEKKRIYVIVELVSKDNKVDILFKFAKQKDKSWKAYDIEILGISVIKTYRTQFLSLFKKGGAELLLEKMREQKTEK